MTSTKGLYSLIIASMLLMGCGRPGSESGGDSAFDRAWQESVNIDSSGVANIAEGDTIHSESGLVMYETTGPLTYDPGKQTEVFAFEIYAQNSRQRAPCSTGSARTRCARTATLSPSTR